MYFPHVDTRKSIDHRNISKIALMLITTTQTFGAIKSDSFSALPLPELGLRLNIVVSGISLTETKALAMISLNFFRN